MSRTTSRVAHVRLPLPALLSLTALMSTASLACRPSEAAPVLKSIAQQVATWKPAQIIAELKRHSTGNVADAVEEATGAPGFMKHDMRPIYKAKVIGPAATVSFRRVLKTDARAYPNAALELLDEAAPGSVLVFVFPNDLDTAALGNLMATTAKVRGLAGAVVDGAVRDIDEIEQIGLPIWARSTSPATSVGRYVSVGKNEPVTCANVLVRPGDWIVADVTGVVVIPKDKLGEVVDNLRKYDDKETKMVPIIKETKSMLKAMEKYNRY
jgi:regulator of RNase E activity RraA